MEPPELVTTVRVDGDRTLTTDGPFVAVREALGGYLLYEADDLDAERRFLERRLAELRAAAARPPADEPGGSGRGRG